MELAFESMHLRSICENEANAKDELGAEVAEVLKRRLADLRAARSINDLITGNPRIRNVGHIEHLVVDLRDGSYIILEANHPKNPLTETGKLDWPKVSRIKVTYIGSEL